jgi:HlyD family secretion protein
VERIVIHPGATVKPGTLILELSNPDLHQQVADAKLSWSAAEARLKLVRANLETQRAREESNVANARSQFNVAQSELEAQKQLAAQGLVAELEIKRRQAQLDQARNTLEMAIKQRDSTIATEESQLAPDSVAATTQKARYEQLAQQLEDLQVKSTMSGTLQLVNVEVGQSVGANTNLARVSDPTRLKANVRISETQGKDLAIGLPARVDTRQGIVRGFVSRIDPSATGGTIGVDVSIEDELPAGARPDLSVDGTIELQKLEDVLYVESPTFGQEGGKIMLFKVLPNRDAVRTQVTLGKRSVQFVEVVSGLEVGDQVVLSDMSQYDGHDKIRITGS